ncbi:MAG: PP2C family protein-serine/threonine phosphatase [Acidobacteriota bacterium]
MVDTPSATDYRALLRRVDDVVRHIENSDTSGSGELAIPAILRAIISELKDDLGIYGGRLYERSGEHYVLRAVFPDDGDLDAVRIPRNYEPLELTLMRGVVYMSVDDDRVDRDLEARLGVHEFAAIEVGSERYVLGFNVAPGHHSDDVVSSLGVVRHTLNQKIREQNLESILHQAKLIQSSILPRRAPHHPIFDIAGRTEALETVGGDLLDFIPIHDKILGLAIADASGHGFPAALQVRDVYTGLRMGLARDLKIVTTVERLNRIIQRSTLTSRFVSLFYGEIETNGLFIYVNAGHPPPFRLRADGRVDFLRDGGPILGPLADATYDRGFVRLEPGDLLVIYTDGVTETFIDEGKERHEYGVDRLVETVRTCRGCSSAALVDRIFHALDEFTGGAQRDDDRTLIVVRYPEEE